MEVTLDSPVPSLQKASELLNIVKLYDGLAPENVLEIGSMFGGTLWYWMKYGRPTKVCSVDLPVPMGDPRYVDMVAAHLEWPKWTRFHMCELSMLMGRSDTLPIIKEVRRFFKQGIDFLFIDGGHMYEEVRKDFETYAPLVNKGGVVVFHDIIGGKYDYGVEHYWNEILHNYPARAEFVEDRNQGECGIGVLWM